MIRDSPEELLAIIRSFASDPKKPVAVARREYSAFYQEFQGEAVESARQDRYEIGPGLQGFWISVPESTTDRVILFLHGGGFTAGSTGDFIGTCVRIARAAKATVFSVDYRLAPEGVFPAAAEDAVAAYLFLVAHGIRPRRIVPVGISAGGTLVLDLLLALRDEGATMPPAAVCLSPVVDMLFGGESMKKNLERDSITSGDLDAMRTHYLAGHDATDPLASPIYARLNGLPRLYVQAGSHELLFDSIGTFVDKARWAGVPVQFEVWEGMFHSWQVFADQIPEGKEAIDHIGAFLQSV
jgi:epsilon-lactone hydrolase